MKHIPHAALLPLFALALLPTAAFVHSLSADEHGTSQTSQTSQTAQVHQARGASGVPRASVPGTGSSASAPVVIPERAVTSSPRRVRVPALGISSPLEQLRTTDNGELAAPRAWQHAGWFSQGTRPGGPGPAVIAGHVDSPNGPAVFARLSELTQGDEIEVDRRDGSTVRFQVDRTMVVAKNHFPTAAVYGPTPDAQLRLITCDGPYVDSSGGYQDNLVVFASEVPA